MTTAINRCLYPKLLALLKDYDKLKSDAPLVGIGTIFQAILRPISPTPTQ